jgi:hypothetical protein
MVAAVAVVPCTAEKVDDGAAGSTAVGDCVAAEPPGVPDTRINLTSTGVAEADVPLKEIPISFKFMRRAPAVE